MHKYNNLRNLSKYTKQAMIVTGVMALLNCLLYWLTYVGYKTHSTSVLGLRDTLLLTILQFESTSIVMNVIVLLQSIIILFLPLVWIYKVYQNAYNMAALDVRQDWKSPFVAVLALRIPFVNIALGRKYLHRILYLFGENTLGLHNRRALKICWFFLVWQSLMHFTPYYDPDANGINTFALFWQGLTFCADGFFALTFVPFISAVTASQEEYHARLLKQEIAAAASAAASSTTSANATIEALPA